MPRRKTKSSKRPVPTSTKKYVKRVISTNQEKKHYEVQGLDTAMSATGTVVALSNVPQGDTDQSRDGDRIKANSIALKYYLETTGGGAADAQVCRVLLLQYRTDHVPALSDVLADATAGDACASQTHWDHRTKYKILYDRRHQVDPRPGAAIGGVIRYKGFNRQMQFEAGGTTGSNKFYLMHVCSNSVDLPTITYMSRLVYTDS